MTVDYNDELVYGPYEKVNLQTALFIKRFGLDDRLFTREVNGVSVDNEFAGTKRSYAEMAKEPEVTKEPAAQFIPEVTKVQDKNEIELDFNDL